MPRDLPHAQREEAWLPERARLTLARRRRLANRAAYQQRAAESEKPQRADGGGADALKGEGK
eukprot:5526997-Alexandrium_andersonii.AAC.1